MVEFYIISSILWDLMNLGTRVLHSTFKNCSFSGVALCQRGEQHSVRHQELPHEDDPGQGGQHHRDPAAGTQPGPVSDLQLCAGEKEMELQGCN